MKSPLVSPSLLAMSSMLLAAPLLSPSLRAQVPPPAPAATAAGYVPARGEYRSPDGSCELMVRPALGNMEAEATICLAGRSPADPSARLLTLMNLGSQSPVDAFWSPDSNFLAVVVRHRKYHDILMFRRVLLDLGGGKGGIQFVQAQAAPVPAGGILAQFPKAGKPGGRTFKLDAMAVTRCAWAPESPASFTVEATLFVLDADGVARSPSYAYSVVYAVVPPSTPVTPEMLTAGVAPDCQVVVSNVVLLPLP